MPYTSEQMFRLVADIEAYPQFLSSCKSARVLKQHGNQVEAQLCLAKSGIEQCFSTQNTNLEFESIELQLLDGPFTSFEGLWSFREIADLGCKVEFHLGFDMKRSLIQKIASRLVADAANNLVDSVCQRAEKIYS